MPTTSPSTATPQRQPRPGMMATLCLLCLACMPLRAQMVPDAGSLMRSTERSLELRQPARVESLYPPELHISPDDRTPRSFESFQIRGLKLLKTEDVLPRLASYQGQPLETRELPALTRPIEAAYQAAGLRARVYIPRQNLNEPTLVIQVIELPASGRP